MDPRVSTSERPGKPLSKSTGEEVDEVANTRRIVALMEDGHALARPGTAGEPGRPKVKGEDRRRLISNARSFKAERRGFVGGDPDQDWYEAEQEISELLGPPGNTPMKGSRSHQQQGDLEQRASASAAYLDTAGRLVILTLE